LAEPSSGVSEAFGAAGAVFITGTCGIAQTGSCISSCRFL
jgi:hypothetical protein